MKSRLLMTSTIVAAVLPTISELVVGAETLTRNADHGATVATWPFFAFDNGVGRDQGWKPSRQVELTDRLGFDGIGYTHVKDLESRYSASDANGQRIFSFYEPFTLGQDDALTPKTMHRLSQLKGRNAILWIHVRGQVTEEIAVAKFREIAEETSKYGVRVAIYPHDGLYVETGRHALRLAKAVDRENFGISINVCHELKAGKGGELIDLVKDSVGSLFLVSINGADQVENSQRQRDWSRLIQPLGEGDFDIRPLLKQLRVSGYEGPIGLQCYGIPGEIDDLLKKSIDAWREIVGPTKN